MQQSVAEIETKIRERIVKLDKKQNYQKYLIIFVITKTIIDSISGTMPDFIFMNPLFECGGVLTPEEKACQMMNQCKITNDFTAIVPTGLYCDNEGFRSVIQSMYNFGVIVGMVTLVPFGDFGGKRLTILISIVMQIIGTGLTMLGIQYINWAILILGQFVLGVSYAGFDIASYVMTVEYLRDKLCQTALMLTCASWGLSQMLFLPIYYLIPEWYSFLWYAVLIPNIGFLMISLYFLIQHPTFVLLRKKDLDQFNKNVFKLSIYNESQLQLVEELRQLGSSYIQQSSKQQTQQSGNKKKQLKIYLKKIFCNKRNLVNLICLIFIYTGLNIYFSGAEDSMERTGYNYGITMFVVGIQQSIAFLGFSFFANKFKRRKGLAVSVLVTSLVGLSFLIDFVKQSLAIQTIGISISTAFGVFSYSFFVLMEVQSFSVDVMSTAQGTIESLGEICLLFVPYLVIRMNDIGIHPLVALSSFLLIFGLVPIVFLKETLGTFKVNQKVEQKNLQQSIAKQTDNQVKQKQNLSL